MGFFSPQLTVYQTFLYQHTTSPHGDSFVQSQTTLAWYMLDWSPVKRKSNVDEQPFLLTFHANQMTNTHWNVGGQKPTEGRGAHAKLGRPELRFKTRI